MSFTANAWRLVGLPGVLTMQNSLTELLWHSKYLKWLQQPPSPWNLTQSKPDINGVKRKYCGVHLINFYGWPSKIFYDLLKFRGNPFLHLPENLLLNRFFLSCVLENFLVYAYYWRIDKVINQHFIQSN